MVVGRKGRRGVESGAIWAGQGEEGKAAPRAGVCSACVGRWQGPPGAPCCHLGGHAGGLGLSPQDARCCAGKDVRSCFVNYQRLEKPPFSSGGCTKSPSAGLGQTRWIQAGNQQWGEMPSEVLMAECGADGQRLAPAPWTMRRAREPEHAGWWVVAGSSGAEQRPRWP